MLPHTLIFKFQMMMLLEIPRLDYEQAFGGLTSALASHNFQGKFWVVSHTDVDPHVRHAEVVVTCCAFVAYCLTWRFLESLELRLLSS